MPRRFYEQDGNLSLLKGKKIAIIGYGSQGHAHALNLKDQGADVIVGLPASSQSRAKATAAGLQVFDTPEAARLADVIMILVPDHLQGDLYTRDIAPHLTKGKTLMFAHGFSIHFNVIKPPADVDVSMIAPKAPGHRMREVFTEGSGVPGLLAVHQDASGHAVENALAYAAGVGCLRAGVIETTFREETESDLFGEQAVLCGGVSELISAGFETLVNAGYAPEIAYFECLHELKLIVDLIYVGGLDYMRYSISNTAEWGDLSVGPVIIDAGVKQRMKEQLKRIQNGEFAKGFREEYAGGMKRFKALYDVDNDHPLETTGRKLRAMMPWLKAKTPPKD